MPAPAVYLAFMLTSVIAAADVRQYLASAESIADPHVETAPLARRAVPDRHRPGTAQSLSDVEFARQARAISTAIVLSAGQILQRPSTVDPEARVELRDLAEDLQQIHERVRHEVARWVNLDQTRGVIATALTGAPSTCTEQQRSMNFFKVQIALHRELIALFRDQYAHGHSGALRQWAASELLTFETQLERLVRAQRRAPERPGSQRPDQRWPVSEPDAERRVSSADLRLG